ncbi:hypothetical protein GOP47_0009998 [Adiantum capillus-veneris]|uniref:phosphoserine phosphatase n=1 Tax=Adiantum capillus-veneris TaxID=13818 RepID=A0A9D4UXV0_ADICA|nr:hypothetical protein GOP47_0009634 [Adiantum capillus-veneris]KAI5075922.1 hypothetical protein GOP47_0009998 [Adiantum capillus-veneris]
MEAVLMSSCTVVGAFSISRPRHLTCSPGLSSRSRKQHWVLPPRRSVGHLIMRASSTLPASISSPPPCPSPSQDTLGIWQAADAVCFDVDSTVCTDEGIDALGEFCGAGKAVAAWTSRAMGGSVPFEDALAARLALFKPSLMDVESFLASNPPKISPGIEELIRKLHSKGKAVYLISGGFRQMIAPVAKILRIQEENIFANKLLFNENGSYAGFDIKEPTSKSGGKAAAIAHLKQKFGYKKLVMIGDGATDLEARQPGGADIFVCFGGVQFRVPVAAQADWCVLNFRDLIESL